MKLALREEMTPGESLPEKVAWLERVGLEGIELTGRALDLPIADLRAVFAGSPVAAANVDGARTLLDPDPRQREAGRELVRRRLALAGELGSAGVLLVPQFGRTPALPDLSPLKTAKELERELFLLQIRELAPAATAAGVPLFLEPLNRYEAHLVNRVGQGAALAAEAGPGIGVMADFFHMNIEEADIPAAIREAGPHLVYVHVADSNRLQPGRGHLDFGPGFATLKAIGYDGYLGIECRVEGPFEEALRESAALLREAWARA